MRNVAKDSNKTEKELFISNYDLTYYRNNNYNLSESNTLKVSKRIQDIIL